MRARIEIAKAGIQRTLPMPEQKERDYRCTGACGPARMDRSVHPLAKGFVEDTQKRMVN